MCPDLIYIFLRMIVSLGTPHIARSQVPSALRGEMNRRRQPRAERNVPIRGRKVDGSALVYFVTHASTTALSFSGSRSP
jgi:hypothetical protein